MAIVAHLVEKTNIVGSHEYDGVRAVVLAIDDAVDTTAALIQARAVTVLNANGFNMPVGYFNKNTAIATTYDAADDFTAIDGQNVAEVIA